MLKNYAMTARSCLILAVSSSKRKTVVTGNDICHQRDWLLIFEDRQTSRQTNPLLYAAFRGKERIHGRELKKQVVI